MEEKNWNESKFSKKVRITDEDLEYLKTIRGKLSIAGKLSEIIGKHKNHAENKAH